MSCVVPPSSSVRLSFTSFSYPVAVVTRLSMVIVLVRSCVWFVS